MDSVFLCNCLPGTVCDRGGWWGAGWVLGIVWGCVLLWRVALWCNDLAAVLWNSMKAEITETRLVEQRRSEHLQIILLFVSLTLTRKRNKRAVSCVCSSADPFALPLPCSSYSVSFLYLYTSFSRPWRLTLNSFYSRTRVKRRKKNPCFPSPFLSVRFLCRLFSLLFRPVHISSKAPLFYVSLDNGSDTLTLALT